MERILKTLLHPDGKRRILIVQRSSGLFGYEVEKLTCVHNEELHGRCQDMFWQRSGQYPVALCETPEIAEREARGRIEWLKDVL